MYKWHVEYTDFNGVERKEDCRFHLSEAELADMNMSTEGGLQNYMQKIVDSPNVKELSRMFREIILKSYGEISPDGRRFVKVVNGQHLSEEFSQTEAFNIIYMGLITDANKAAEFMKGILPAKLSEKVAAMGNA